MRRRAAAAVLLAVTMSAACSGTSSVPASTAPTPSPSITVPGGISSTGAVPADYLAKVDASCTGPLAELRKRGRIPLAPTDPSNLTARELRGAAAYLQRGADVQRAAAAALGRFAPPPAGVDVWAVYRAAVAQFAAGTQAEASAAAAGDVAGFLGAAQRLLEAQRKASESGLAVGLGAGTACARLF